LNPGIYEHRNSIELRNNHISGRTIDLPKIVYFEVKKSRRLALQRVRELNMLNRKKLSSLVRESNPEMFDYKDTWMRTDNFPD